MATTAGGRTTTWRCCWPASRSPSHPADRPRYNPIHEDDIIATIPKLLEVASVPATTVNWAGHQIVSLQEWCTYLGSLVGREPVYEENDARTARESR